MKFCLIWRLLFLAVLAGTGLTGRTATSQSNATTLFMLGEADGSALEFGGAEDSCDAFHHHFPKVVVYRVGRDTPTAWPYIHPANHDRWAGGSNHTFTIRFSAPTVPAEPLFLIVGQAEAHSVEQPLLTVAVNGQPLPSRRIPAGSNNPNAAGPGQPASSVFALLPGTVRAGENSVSLTLSDGSWMVYDYVRLGTDEKPPKLTGSKPMDLLAKFQAGPMQGVEEIVFAVRKVIPEHWYANFSYYASDAGRSYFGNGNKLYRDGGRLCKLNLRTRQVTVLVDDPRGGVRDPQVSYDGHKVLFSYRKDGSDHYLLHEINADGSGLRQLTDGDCDDFEGNYLPDGGIVFVSSRCNRWVNCWLSQVAVLYRCDADGRNIQALSSNNEQDNTPCPLPDGRILYTRWEYVDRSQVDYHHLWVINPDGTGQMIYYGNMNPSTVMIDAKGIPGSDRIVASFSPGHGQTEHEGSVAVVDPKAGPDARTAARIISRGANYRDPWAFSETCFMAAQNQSVMLMDERGRTQEIFRLSDADNKAGFHVHEPRPLAARPREALLPTRAHPDQPNGRLMLANVYQGRNMAGVKPGEIKKLLVLESLPKPINFTGGMEPLSYGGTFTLERVLGTVPVESDGSAYLEVPALRSVFFVALDRNNLSVKRMQSFVTVQPGEVTSCVGCHEQRTQTARAETPLTLAARRAPSHIEPIADVPQVMDFPRDIQPILDRHCVNCHDYAGTNHGRVFLTSDRGPLYSISYFTLTARSQVSDGRNRARSNYAPRSLGSSASPLMQKLEPAHYGVQLSGLEKKIVRLWIETGAPYPGTYSALGCGMIGGYAQNSLDRSDLSWPATKPAMETLGRRCADCHSGRMALPLSASDEHIQPPWEDMSPNDPRRQYSRHLLYNLTRPERSLLLLAPLAKEDGGLGLCRRRGTGQGFTNEPALVFLGGRADPDYAKILAHLTAAKQKLDEIKRFDMPDFQPRIEWVREMKRYGVLPWGQRVDIPLNPYLVEQDYWKSLWYRPPGT